MHYVFDLRLKRHYPSLLWCRYADDGIVHCKTERESKEILEVLKNRFLECGLQLHPEKTRIVYCKDGKRKNKYANTTFEFLGFAFRPRVVKAKKGYLFISFTPSVSEKSLRSMRDKIKWIGKRRNVTSSLMDIAQIINPKIIGWINYYGRYRCSGLYPIWREINKALITWSMRKFKKLNSKTKAAKFIKLIAHKQANLLAHWKQGMKGAFA
jgi:RNA-directed DNA polymerase